MTTRCVVRTRARPSRSETLGVPLIKISLRFARAVGDACPYRFDCFLKINVCRGGFHMLPKKKGRIWNPPLPVCEVFDILVVGATIGRPWAFYERPWTVNLRSKYGRLPLRVCARYNLLLVGAIRNVFEENLRLAKQSPVNKM